MENKAKSYNVASSISSNSRTSCCIIWLLRRNQEPNRAMKLRISAIL
jgi:hypothetical protein